MHLEVAVSIGPFSAGPTCATRLKHAWAIRLDIRRLNKTILDFLPPPSANSTALAFELPSRSPLRISYPRRIFPYRIDLPPLLVTVTVASAASAVARAYFELELVARRRRCRRPLRGLTAFLVGPSAKERPLRRHLTRRR